MMLLTRNFRGTPLTLVIRHTVVLRAAPIRSFIRAKGQPSCLRFKTTSTRTAGTEAAASKSIPPNHVYGPKLCVYHAGTGKTTFLACLKLSTLFIFAFFGFVVTPAYFEKEGISPTVARTVLSAIIPLVFVAYTTSPFVTFIHMRLPPFARQSEEMLRRYIRTLPPQTELEMTTMSFIAKPRLSMVKLSDLARVNRRFGIVNLARDTATENATRKWYMFPAVGNFNVQKTSGTAKVPWVWDSIWNNITTRQP
ncbi:hypothetical protein HD806DRAFT_493756 [Xylariaceae sp. AK1471]|nr:hypothetical protein HD806DRAFT_493756 [Xylariaceae sp. AK1471]